MHSSKTKTGLSEATPNRTTPATPKVSKLSKASAKSDCSSSPGQNLRLSVNNSPRSVDSKPPGERRLSKGSALLDKQQRSLKPSELHSQLDAILDDLKKAKEKLVSLEKEKAQVTDELVAAKKLADEANEKFQEALAAQKQAEDSSEIEKFRADELEQAGIWEAQKKEEEWQKEVEVIRNQHAADVSALLSTTQELQRLKNELSMITEAKNAALVHADDAMKIAEINAEKAEVLSGEVCRLKASLDSMLETKSNEDAQLVEKLHSEIDLLKEELEKAKKAEVKLSEMEALIVRLKAEVTDAKQAELDAYDLVHEMKEKVELLEAQVEGASKSERSASESLTSMKEKLEKKEALLQEANSEVASLKENAESLNIALGRYKVDLEDSNCHLEKAKQEVLEVANVVENLKSELQGVKEDKSQALNNEMLALKSVQSLLDEKNKLIGELEALRNEEEKNKSAMESLASALHEISSETRDVKEKLATNQEQLIDAESRIEELNSTLKDTKIKYEPMLDNMKEKISHLEDLAEKYKTEATCSKAELDKKELDLAMAMKKSEEELDTFKREMDVLAENSKAEWQEKEIGFIASIKESENEIIALKERRGRLLDLLKEREEEAQIAKEDGDQLRNALDRAESEANSAKESAEKANLDCLLLKERLLEKEIELECITQEKCGLQIREVVALEKVEELTKLIAEASAKKTEENVEPSNSEKSYDLHSKMDAFSEENANESHIKSPMPEIPVEYIEESGDEGVAKNDILAGESDATFDAKENDGHVDVEEKMSDKGKIAHKDLLPDREAEPESVEDETYSKVDGNSFDQANELSSGTMVNGEISPLKQLHKKKPLLRKFGSMLKKKSNPK